jgi:hypothetical protein
MAKEKARKGLPTTAHDQDQQEMPASRFGHRKWWGVAAAFLLVLTVYGFRLDRIIGLIVDDAWYVMLGKSLATGQGYTLINSPYSGLAPVYPPFYPFLLSVVFRLQPSFPQNVLGLKLVGCLAMLGVGVLSLYWLRNRGKWPFWLALLGALSVMLTPALVFLATSTTMSECVFMLVLLAGIILFEQAFSQADDRKQQLLLSGAGVLAALVFLTRSLGIALAVAGVLYLVKERRWRLAVLYGATFVLVCAPWLWYARQHAPNPEQQQLQGGMIMSGYLTNFWQQRAGLNEKGEIELNELPKRIWDNTVTLTSRDFAMLYAPLLYRSAKLSGMETVESSGPPKLLAVGLTGLILLGFILCLRQRLSVLELFVLIYLALVLAWPWATFRFLVPLVTFWLYYLLTGLLGLLDVQKNFSPVWRWRVPGILLSCVLMLSLVDHVWYLKVRHDPAPAEAISWTVVYNEYQEALNWIKQRTPEDAVVTAGNPALVYLYTGRKAVWFEYPEKNWEGWKRLNVRYLAHLRPQPIQEPSWMEGRFDLAYRSTGQLKLRVTNLGPPEKRVPWSLFNVPGNIIDVQK